MVSLIKSLLFATLAVALPHQDSQSAPLAETISSLASSPAVDQVSNLMASGANVDVSAQDSQANLRRQWFGGNHNYYRRQETMRFNWGWGRTGEIQ